MKYLLALITIGLLACGNPKEEIVNQQIQLKGEIKKAVDDETLAYTEYSVQQTINDAYKAIGDPDADKVSIDSLHINYVKAKLQRESLQERYDSLELELKKY